MTQQDVQRLLQDMESDRIERTISFREDKLGPAVCAFANDLPGSGQPGYLLLGVKDDGSLAGLDIGDAELQKIGDVRQNGNVLPPPHLSVSPVFHFEGGDVVTVKVDPADFPPVRYKGRVHIRVGPRKGIATEQEERQLIEKRVAHARTFDEQPCRQSSLDDLNMEYFKLRYLPTAIDAETLEANKPVFLLKPADGAIGAHVQAVRKVYTDFETLTERIARQCSLEQQAYSL